MGFSALTQPHAYMAGYSSVPLRVTSNEITNTNRFKYLVNISLSSYEIDTAQAYSFNNNSYTKINFKKEHDIKRGDTILIDDSDNSGIYSNYYNVTFVEDSTSVVCDFGLGPAMTGNPIAHKIIKYKLDPDLESEAKLDLGDTLKDFVTQNLEDTNDIYAAPDTKQSYELIVGKEAEEVFTFEDNLFDSGNVGFNNTSLVSSFTATTSFAVGDIIVVDQDLFEWTYTDNYFSTNLLSFTSTTNQHSFRSGQTINVTGQITEPNYNGTVKIESVPDNYSLKTFKTFTTSTPVEGGTILGTPRPEYNGTAKIIEIYWTPSLGGVIVTDKGFTDSSEPISGNIRKASEQADVSPVDLSITGLSIYNSRVETVNYGFDTDQFDPYVCQVRSSNLNNISTILGNTEKYRIEKESKSWLLAHSFDTSAQYWEPRISMYNSAGSLISAYRLDMTYAFGPSVGINTYINNGGNVRLDGTSAHGLSVGDYVEVFTGPYAGISTVLQVNSISDVTIDVAFTTSSTVGGETFRGLETNDGSYDYYFPVGLNQIVADTNKTLLSGSSLSTIIDDVDYYNVELEYSGTPNTNTIQFEINKDCSRYEVFHLIWKDRNGSWLSYPFKYISDESTEVDRKNFYKTEGRWNLNDDTFGFDTFGRGEQTYFARSRDKYVITSGWVEEYENELLKDMLKSASVYMQLPSGTIIGAQIKDKDKQFKKKQSDYLFNYKFEVVASRNDIRI